MPAISPKLLTLLLIFILFGFSGIHFTETPYELKIPAGFPKPGIPYNNRLTVERVKLGKMLFFDKILSSDKSISCASCHIPANSFSDTVQFSRGVHDSLGVRNTMPLINLAWSRSFFWDGGVPSLELQVLKPLTSHNEMNLSLPEAVERLKKNAAYRNLFMEAYGSPPDAGTLFKALASYERTLVSGNSKFDRYFYQKDSSAFNASERRGYRIFFDDEYKMHCAACHSGVNFTNDSYQNNGLYMEYQDQGRYLITAQESDKGKFKVPTLRNIALTAPYMHDGSMKTLYEVVEHYNLGNKEKPHPNKSPHVHVHGGSFLLTETEKTDLVNFLKTLTDEEFIQQHKQQQ